MKTSAQPTEYDIQASEFLAKNNLTLTLEFQGKRKYFPDDKEARNVYSFTITNAKGVSYTGTFGDSIANSTLPEYV